MFKGRWFNGLPTFYTQNPHHARKKHLRVIGGNASSEVQGLAKPAFCKPAIANSRVRPARLKPAPSMAALLKTHKASLEHITGRSDDF